MSLRFREYANAENDPGVWFPYTREGDKAPCAEICIRNIPAAKERQLRSNEAKTQRVRLLKERGVSEIELDLEESRETARARAAFALKDTRPVAGQDAGVDVEVGDEATASTYSKLLSAVVVPGTILVLDGKWNDALKAHFLYEHSDLVNFILEKLDGVRVSHARDEEKRAGNS